MVNKDYQMKRYETVSSVSRQCHPTHRRGVNADRQCVVIPSYKRMFICDGGAAARVAAAALGRTAKMRAFSGRITDVSRRRFSLCTGER